METRPQLNGLMRTHHCGELRAAHKDEKVILCGWVNKIRDMGQLFFIDLRDRFGLTQINFENLLNKDDVTKVLKEISLESVIKVTGSVGPRPESAINKNMDTGDVEVVAESVELLSGADKDSIPFLPHGVIESNEDLKLKYRYLDLRTHKLQKNMKIRAQTMHKTRNFLTNLGFMEVETPILYKSTPEGARDFIVPSRVSPEKVYALPQSPQTLKQLLMIGGTDKYFQICRCFRDEDLRAERQPEFSQIDIEASFATSEYLQELAQALVYELFGDKAEYTFKKMSFQEAMDLYGCDKPDTRFGLIHHDLTRFFRESEFKVFQSVAETNGLVKAMFVPLSDGQFSRKDLDSFNEVVRPIGGKGVAFIKWNQGKASGGISKFVKEDLAQYLQELHSEDGHWLFVADSSADMAHQCSDTLRRHLGKKLNLIDENAYNFLWVDQFPLFEYSETEDRFMARHHPFTAPAKDSIEEFLNFNPGDDLSNIIADAYDVVCNGYEIGGGSIRIHNPTVQQKMFELLGMSPEEIQSQFGFFVEALKYGVPPHGGIAFGLDRTIMLQAKTESIRDVIAFPKTNSATDLMAGSPSRPADQQIEELHFQWKDKKN